MGVSTGCLLPGEGEKGRDWPLLHITERLKEDKANTGRQETGQWRGRTSKRRTTAVPAKDLSSRPRRSVGCELTIDRARGGKGAKVHPAISCFSNGRSEQLRVYWTVTGS